jgi:hypothetical protein
LKTYLFEWPGMTPDVYNAVMPAIECWCELREEIDNEATPSTKESDDE